VYNGTFVIGTRLPGAQVEIIFGADATAPSGGHVAVFLPYGDDPFQPPAAEQASRVL
jgi:hypothetical protein